MENKYVFGGFVMCSGTMDDGKSWKNYNILLARVDSDQNGNDLPPRSGIIAKARYSDELCRLLTTLKLGSLVNVYFDERGKVSILSPVPSNK